jgi:hypothetical protein
MTSPLRKNRLSSARRSLKLTMPSAVIVRLFGEHAANEQIVELMDIVDGE